MTSLRAFAERVLLGATLEDKLAGPDDVVDVAPGPALTCAPSTPGRPAALRLDRAPDERAAPPNESDLADPRARGRLLHAFANHELLALELFALALLRFPDAPSGFRAGVAHVMRDEQAHLGAYLERMRALGVSFGDDAPSAFFWTALAPVDTLEALVAGLSLTFEQANLDFAAHHAAVLRRLGDEETARLLDRVLADEIRHVKHGVTWFERWKDPASSDWDAWLAVLPRPLVARRARGRGPLQREARRAAGLSDEFVRRLALAGESTGRTPVVHAFLPAFEHELAGEPASTAALAVARDQATLPLFLARRGDVVLVPRGPSLDWLDALSAAGVELPELLVSGDDLRAGVASLRGRPLSGLAPWGWGPGARALLEPLFRQVRPGPFEWLPDESHARVIAQLASKAWAAARSGSGSLVCTDEASALAALRALPGRAVVKAPWGTSGRGALRIDGGEPDLQQVTWLRRTLERQGAVVIEPWLDRTVDLSVQLDVRGPDDVRIIDITRFFADRRGQYAGHVIGPHDAGLDGESRRLLGERKAGAASGLDVLRETARAIGRELAAAGHRGPAGVDALLHRDASGALRLRPLVEVNPRLTMGRIAVELRRLLARGRVGLWLHVPATRAAKAGHASLADLARAATATAPLRVEAGRLAEGVLPTNDPSTASVVLGLLCVDPTLEGCAATLRRVGLDVPPPQ